MKKILSTVFLALILLTSFDGYSNQMNDVKHYDEVKDFTVPPWKMYPELAYRSMGWRMGYGEYYIHRWYKYYLALNEKDKDTYKEKNPESESWKGFYSQTDEHFSKLKIQSGK